MLKSSNLKCLKCLLLRFLQALELVKMVFNTLLFLQAPKILTSVTTVSNSFSSTHMQCCDWKDLANLKKPGFVGQTATCSWNQSNKLFFSCLTAYP